MLIPARFNNETYKQIPFHQIVTDKLYRCAGQNSPQTVTVLTYELGVYYMSQALRFAVKHLPAPADVLRLNVCFPKISHSDINKELLLGLLGACFEDSGYTVHHLSGICTQISVGLYAEVSYDRRSCKSLGLPSSELLTELMNTYKEDRAPSEEVRTAVNELRKFLVERSELGGNVLPPKPSHKVSSNFKLRHQTLTEVLQEVNGEFRYCADYFADPSNPFYLRCYGSKD